MSYGHSKAEFSELLGKTIVQIGENAEGAMVIVTADGITYHQHHDQSCCESVQVEEIVGDLKDLIGEPLVEAEEVTSEENPKEGTYDSDAFLWTFYKLRTKKGAVTIRWYGESNGYYGVEVQFVRVSGLDLQTTDH